MKAGVISCVLVQAALTVWAGAWYDSSLELWWTFNNLDDGTVEPHGSFSPGGDYSDPEWYSSFELGYNGDEFYRRAHALQVLNIPPTLNGMRISRLGDYAFANLDNLASVSIPDGVTGISSSAFFGCDQLMSNCRRSDGLVVVDRCVIHLSQYSGQWDLDDVVLPAGTRMIADLAFAKSPTSYTSIKSLAIPSGVTVISETAFKNCRIGSFSVDPASDSYCVVDGVLYDKSMTTLIHCSADKRGVFEIPPSVTNIFDSAFRYCTGLIRVKIPKGVTKIGDGAFWGCNGIADVVIPQGVTSIGERAFYDCARLKKVTVPRSVTSIGAYAFYGCNGLDSVVVLGDRLSLGYGAFYSVPLKSAAIPWEAIQGEMPSDYDDWADCFNWFGWRSDALTVFLLHPCNEDAKYSDSTAFQTKLTYIKNNLGCEASICHAMALDDGSIVQMEASNRWFMQNAMTYDGGSALQSGRLSDSQSSTISMKVFGPAEVSFYWKVSSESDYDWLRFSVDGEKKEEISGSKGWLRVSHTIPAGRHKLDWCYSKDGSQSSGSDCGWVDDIVVSSTGCTWLTSDKTDGTVRITGVEPEPKTVLVIPESVDGKKVSEIGNDAFLGCSEITSAVVPEGVTKIGDRAFYGCAGMQSASIATSVASIGEQTFAGCSGLGNGPVTSGNWLLCFNGDSSDCVIPEGVRRISDGALKGCDKLTSVTIPASVVSVGLRAFADCSALEYVRVSDLSAWCKIDFGSSNANPLYYANRLYLDETEVSDVVVPSSVTNVGRYAFYNCKGLKTVRLANGVKSIGSYAFYGCDELVSVIAEDGLGSVDSSAFESCIKLESVSLPSSVKYIGTSTFRQCVALMSFEVGCDCKLLTS